MNTLSLITKWVNDFRIANPDVLKEKSKGRRKQVSKPTDTKPNVQIPTNENTDYLN